MDIRQTAEAFKKYSIRQESRRGGEMESITIERTLSTPGRRYSELLPTSSSSPSPLVTLRV
jgi:hypothetical protein